MNQPVAPPISRYELAALARSIRRATGFEHNLEFPIIEFIELIMPEIFTGYHFIVGTKEDMGDIHGLSNRKEGFIMLREDIYEGARAGKGRDRLTSAHEVGHFILHESPVFAKTKGIVKTFCQPEWQADAFGGELLVPGYLARGMSPVEISNKCLVSLDAARVQYDAIRRRYQK